LGDCFSSQEKDKKNLEREGGKKKGKNLLNFKKITVG
jgi:hypothetical protein